MTPPCQNLPFKKASYTVYELIDKLDSVETLAGRFYDDSKDWIGHCYCSTYLHGSSQLKVLPVPLDSQRDAFVEYLLKQWLQTGKTIDHLRDDYNASISGVGTVPTLF